jgi:hypothetical protein
VTFPLDDLEQVRTPHCARFGGPRHSVGPELAPFHIMIIEQNVNRYMTRMH